MVQFGKKRLQIPIRLLLFLNKGGLHMAGKPHENWPLFHSSYRKVVFKNIQALFRKNFADIWKLFRGWSPGLMVR